MPNQLRQGMRFVAGRRGDFAPPGAHFPARRGRTPPSCRGNRGFSERSTLEGPDSVLRVFPRRQRRRHRRKSSDRLDWPGGQAHPTKWRVIPVSDTGVDPGAIRFVPARLDHANAFLTMMRALENSDPGTTPFDEARRRLVFEQFVQDDTYGRAWLIALGPQYVGYVVLTVSFSFEYRGCDAYIDELYIAKEHRGQGLAGRPWNSSRKRRASWESTRCIWRSLAAMTRLWNCTAAAATSITTGI